MTRARTASPFGLPFSAATRDEHWRTLGERPFDLLIVGGGITGVGVAHDAAGRGLDVALVEAGDFAEGTSGRSSRLIHGGLRYLETLDFALVFEALAERRRLLRLAPHLVHPLAFLFPVYAGDAVGMWKLRAGMWLYDALSLFRGLSRHRTLDRAAALRQEPALRREGLRGGAVYYDAQVDDARLTLAVARAAHQAGAVVVPHAAAAGFLRDASGRVAGARVRDRLSGGEVEVPARLVLSATGPWTDQLRQLADPAASPRLRPTKGVHIQLRQARVRNHGALIFRSEVDGRVMFVLPWGDFTYIGTTDTDYSGPPERARADEADVEYLLRSANALLPGAALAPADVLSSWAGVRPLVAPEAGPGEVSAGRTSREHDIWRDPSGLLCVAGGKLTTFRTMAADAAAAAAAILRREHGVRTGAYHSEHVALPGAPEGSWEDFRREFQARAARVGLGPATATHLARSYGTDADDILQAVRDDPALAEPILAPHPCLWAELPFAVQREMTLTLEDFLRRRLHLFYDDPDGGLRIAHAVAARMATQPGIGWSHEETAGQLDRYRRSVHRTRPAP